LKTLPREGKQELFYLKEFDELWVRIAIGA